MKVSIIDRSTTSQPTALLEHYLARIQGACGMVANLRSWTWATPWEEAVRASSIFMSEVLTEMCYLLCVAAQRTVSVEAH